MAQGNWTQLIPGTLPPARAWHGMGYDGGIANKIVLFGGEDAAATKLGDTWLWNGVTWTAATPATSPSARNKFCIAEVLGDLYVGFGNDGVAKQDLWIWDGTDWIQEVIVGALPSARYGAAFAYDAAGLHTKLMLWGGSSGDTLVWYYKDITDGWVSVTPIQYPSPRIHHAMFYDPDRNSVILFGGVSLDQTEVYNDIWEWKYGSSTWIELENTGGPPSVRGAALSLVRDTDKKRALLAPTGLYSTSRMVIVPPQYINDAETFDIGATLTTFEFDDDLVATATDVIDLNQQAIIDCIAGANLNDGELFTLNDGVNPAITFEFDDDASVTSGHVLVDISGAPSATTMRDRIVTAINGAAFDIQASNYSSTQVLLRIPKQFTGTAPTLTHSNTVATGNFIITSAAPVLLVVRSATLETPSQAELFDGDTFTLSDGTNTKIFEFDNNASVSGANIAISILGSPSAETMRDRIQSAINALAIGDLAIRAFISTTNTLNLEIQGPIPNQAYHISGVPTVMDGDFQFHFYEPTLENFRDRIITVINNSLCEVKAREGITSREILLVATVAGEAGNTPSYDTVVHTGFSIPSFSGAEADTWTYNPTGRLWSLQNPTLQPPVLDGAALVYDPVTGSGRRTLFMFGGRDSTSVTQGHYRWDWITGGAVPYYSYPGTLNGRVQPVATQAADGSWSMILGVDAIELPSFMLDLGDEITLSQEFNLSAHKLITFVLRVRYSLDLPKYRVIAEVAGPPVNFLTSNVIMNGDAVKAIELPSPDWLPEDQDQLITIDNAVDTANNDTLPGDYFRVSMVPSGQGQISYFDPTKPAATYPAGSRAVIENTAMTPAVADYVDIKRMGAQWRAQCFIDVGSGDELRAEVVENLVQADPDGWQRLTMACHISKYVGVATLKFKLKLEVVDA